MYHPFAYHIAQVHPRINGNAETNIFFPDLDRHTDILLAGSHLGSHYILDVWIG
jgi:hypothetical protein